MGFTAWLSLRGKTSPAPGEDVTIGDKRGNLAWERLRGRTANSLSQNLTVLPAPSGREPLARPQTLHFSRKLYHYAKGPISEDDFPRSGGRCHRR